MNSTSTELTYAYRVKSATGEYGGLASEHYDPMKHPTCANFREASTSLISSVLRGIVSPKASICEVGAGKSIVAELYADDRAILGQLTLVDSSPEMLAYSQPWLAIGASGLVADVRYLPFPDLSFDIVVSSLGDPYNDPPFWDEVSRILKHQGSCVFTIPSYDWAIAFRGSNGTDFNVAEFQMSNGQVIHVPSLIPMPDAQVAMIQEAGLKVVNRRSFTLKELSQTALSPKLCASRGPRASIVDAYHLLKIPFDQD